MAKFLSNTELYETIQQKSLEAKEILWVCSPYLGLGAHTIFSQEILKNPAKDIRFVFRLNDVAVKRGEVNPFEIQYFIDHFKSSSIRFNNIFNAKTYIFDDSALIASVNLTKTAFEANIEAGVLLDGAIVDEVKDFFTERLWQTGKTISDLKKFKKMFESEQKNRNNGHFDKIKNHTKVNAWTDDYVDTWYFGIQEGLPTKTERKIIKDTNWSTELTVAGDIGLSAFRQIKSGDLAIIANLNKKRGKIEIEHARIFDKSKVETDQGDLHFAYEVKKTLELERDGFYEMLKNANINSKSSEVILNQSQIESFTKALSSIKRKRRPKTSSSSNITKT